MNAEPNEKTIKKYRKYLTTKPKSVSNFDWVLKVPELGEKFKNFAGRTLEMTKSVYPNEELYGVRWTRVEWKTK